MLGYFKGFGYLRNIKLLCSKMVVYSDVKSINMNNEEALLGFVRVIKLTALLY